jgi:FlaA1/EpsC-like NDP-sugar epimerase
MTVLVTGAHGSVGSALLKRLRWDVAATDVDTLDVTDEDAVSAWLVEHRPRVVYHLAGAKHAPEGELDPAYVARVNIDGTVNVLAAAASVGAKVVTASTCKACDPETAYGASKLIAERATLNAEGVVVRFHNIPESSGNVFRLWEGLPPDAPLPVTDCWRYFTRLENAVELLLQAASLPSGRYCVPPSGPERMADVAARLYPGRAQTMIPRRRGDRAREPLHAASETVESAGEWLRIVGPHDPARTVAAVAA